MKQSKNNLYKEYDTVKYDVFLPIFYKITNLNTNTQNNSKNNPSTKILQFANNHWRRDMESSTTRSQKSCIRVRSLNTLESSLKLTLKTHPLADKHRITSAERSIHIETTTTSSTSQKDLGQTRTNNTLKIHPLSINTPPGHTFTADISTGNWPSRRRVELCSAFTDALVYPFQLERTNKRTLERDINPLSRYFSLSRAHGVVPPKNSTYSSSNLVSKSA